MTGAARGTSVHGEVSTRGQAISQLTSLPRRQAAHTPPASRADGDLAGHHARATAASPAWGSGTGIGKGGSMGTAETGHQPVLLERIVALLAPALDPPGAVLVDTTLGRAGHARALLDAHPELVLIGLDTDAAAIEESGRLLARYGDRVRLTRVVYDQIATVLAQLGLSTVQGVLFDLGVSSPQLDERDRGFAYSYDAPLDMRMDQEQPLTAAEILNTYPAARLARVLREYGEERFARQIADAVVRERSRAPLSSTGQLTEIIRTAIPAPARRSGGHPAKRTFQALRIEVNGELDALANALPAALDALAIGGRIVVLAYHSLEDRLVKRTLAARAADTTPPGLPVPLAAARPQFRLLTRGAERPSAAEVAANPRAAPARLRAAERIREAA